MSRNCVIFQSLSELEKVIESWPVRHAPSLNDIKNEIRRLNIIQEFFDAFPHVRTFFDTSRIKTVENSLNQWVKFLTRDEITSMG